MILKNAKIINYDQTINNSDIIIENGFIKEIIIKDGNPKIIVIPGFIDVHIHGYNNEDIYSKHSLNAMSQKLHQVGTTTFFPTIMTNSIKRIKNTIKIISSVKKDNPMIAGIHLEGPFISKEKSGAHPKEFIIDGTLSNIKKIIDDSTDIVRKITFDPKNVTKGFIKYLLKNKIVMSIGHSILKDYEADLAIKNGASSITHLWNAMSGIQNRNQGIVSSFFKNKDIFGELICDGLHVDDFALELTLKNNINKIILISDAIKIAGLKDGDYILDNNQVTKKNKLIFHSKTKTIMGSSISIQDALKYLKKFNINENDLVRISSYNQSINMNLKNVGQIVTNYYANINILDLNYNLVDTLLKGKSWKS